jgi:hypothetical protein
MIALLGVPTMLVSFMANVCMIPWAKLFSNLPLLWSIVAKMYIILTYDLAKFTENFLILGNVFLAVGTVQPAGTFPRKEGGIQVLANLVPSSQTAGFLMRTPLGPVL